MNALPQSRAAILAPLSAIVLAAACGGATSASTPTPTITPKAGTRSAPPTAAPASPPMVSRYLTVDQANQAATLKLNIMGPNFNGYSGGQMIVNIPQGWLVTVQCANQSTMMHSCAIALPNVTTPAFPGASSPDPTAGLRPGQQATFGFTAAKAGAYRIACLVPGHEAAGMWDVFNVVTSGSPSISTS